MAEAVINAAIRKEEQSLIAEFDQLLTKCMMECDTVGSAAHEFVSKAANYLRAGSDQVVTSHVRLLQSDGRSLRLVGGTGAYYDSALGARQDIDINDDSPCARTVKDNDPFVVNDTENDLSFGGIVKRLAGHGDCDAIRAALSRIRSFANLPIARDEKALPADGMFTIFSEQQDFFTPWRVKSLKDLARRFPLLLEHVRKKEELSSSLRQLQFLQDITPPLENVGNVYDALAEQVRKIQTATHARAVSCFLQDDLQKNRFVLRAQEGWSVEEWIDAAYYWDYEPLPRQLKYHDGPLHAAAMTEPPNKHAGEMFGPDERLSPDADVVALPLRFKQEKLLGFLLLHPRAGGTGGQASGGFALCDDPLFANAAEIISAFVYAQRSHDFVLWENGQQQRRQRVMDALFAVNSPSIDRIVAEFCAATIREYRFRHCAVFLADDNQEKIERPLRSLRLRGYEEREDIKGKVDPGVRSGSHAKLRSAYDHDSPRQERSPSGGHDRRPKAVRCEGLIERLFLPLRTENGPIGVLDIGWRGISRESDRRTILPHHRLPLLMDLAACLSQIYSARLLRSKAFWAAGALEGTDHYLFARRHTLDKFAREIRDRSYALAQRIDPSHHPQDWEDLQVIIRRANESLEIHLKVQQYTAEAAGYAGKPALWGLSKLIREVVEPIRERVQKTNIAIMEDLNESVMAFVLPEMISDVFYTLVENAVTHHYKEVPAPVDKKVWVSLRALPEKKVALLQVSDNGPDIEQQKVREINHPDQDSAGHRKGGLFYAKLTCQRHHGDLVLRSVRGEGTIVEVFLPLAN